MPSMVKKISFEFGPSFKETVILSHNILSIEFVKMVDNSRNKEIKNYINLQDLLLLLLTLVRKQEPDHHHHRQQVHCMLQLLQQPFQWN